MKTTTLALMRSAMLTLLATILSTTIASKAQTAHPINQGDNSLVL